MARDNVAGGTWNATWQTDAEGPAVEEDRTLVAEVAQGQTRRASLEGQPSSVGRHFVDRPQWRTLEGSAHGISLALYVLAAVAGLGRARGLADDLARVFG